MADIEQGEPAPPESARHALSVPGGTRARAEEWALVLASEGIAADVRPGGRGYHLAVPEADADRAHDALIAYQRENAPAVAPSDTDREGEPLGEPGIAGIVVAFILIACHGLAGSPTFSEVIYDRGSANARAILGGEWWRTVSALFLHADLGHVIGNALFGVYFVTAVTRSLGVGLGLLLVLASGVFGNLLNAVGHAGSHHSIGASTAVFGAIGILSGMALTRRNRSGLRGARLLLPVGAGLGLLAMLGTSGARVDVFAHLYGLLAGGVIGIGTALGLHRRPGPAVQLALTVATIALVVTAFGLALWPVVTSPVPAGLEPVATSARAAPP